MRRTEGVLQLEHMQLHTDAGQQGWMPLSVYKDQQRGGKLPAIVFLHATGGPAVRIAETMLRALVSLTEVLRAHPRALREHVIVQVQIRRR